MSGISGNQMVRDLANTEGEVGATNQIWLFFFNNICYMWFGIVILKIY